MDHPSAAYLDQPFAEAIDFFRAKVNLPTERWDDLQGAMHSRAFTVAGAAKADLLADFRTAIDKAIADGTTLGEFRKDFDTIVARHGWDYKGRRGWRSAVIYDTNLSTAYAAGQHAQMTDPAVLAVRPYWQYQPSSSAEKRPEHVRWYGVTLPWDDPWWQTHRPPNGWGCKCGITSLSRRDYERRKETLRTEAPDDGTYDRVNRITGEVTQVPRGIDPGWDYNPGEAAWGKRLSEKTMADYQAAGGDAWESLTPGDWQASGLPELLTPQPASAALGPKLTSQAAATAALSEIIGGEERVFSFVGTDGFRYDLLVNAEVLAGHVAEDRTPYLPFVPEVLTDPQEVWLRFERHKGTGKVVLRQRIIKLLALDKDMHLVVVADATGGMLAAWTMIPTRQRSYVNKQRDGQLIYRKEE
jgi:hypothetical protein